MNDQDGRPATRSQACRYQARACTEEKTESGRALFAGRFPELEHQLCGLIWDGGYHGPGGSPDRADAMVWALTELMLGPKRAEPRILTL